MFSCQEVLARHSEYLDGALAPDELAALRSHLAHCPNCGRYDRVLRRGLDLLVRQQPAAPDADFLHTLHSRLDREDERTALRSTSITATATLSIAAVLVLATWLPTFFSSSEASQRGYQAAGMGVTASEIAWHAASAVEQPATHAELGEPDVSLTVNNADISLIDRGYSPLILEAPTAPPTYVNASLTTLETR